MDVSRLGFADLPDSALRSAGGEADAQGRPQREYDQCVPVVWPLVFAQHSPSMPVVGAALSLTRC